jgi:adenine/guanine/hypoxanthine permease
MLEKLFKLNENKTNVKTEIIAGITTFMTMAYILFLNPNILAVTGMDKNAVFFATAISAGSVTVAMGLVANFPIALAPGMRLNALFATVALAGVGMPWQVALGAVFISGLIFILLTVTRIRQILVVAVPNSLKRALTVGIGLFITIIGLKLSEIMVVSAKVIPPTLIGIPMGVTVIPAGFAPFSLPDFHQLAVGALDIKDALNRVSGQYVHLYFC